MESRSTTNASNISNLGGRLSSAEGNISSAQSAISGAQSDIASLTTRIGELSAEDTRIYGRVQTVESNISSHASSISSLNTSVGSLQTRMASVELAEDSIVSRVSAVEGRVSQICDIAGWEMGTTTNEREGATYEQVKTSNTTRIRTKGLYPVTGATVCLLSDFGNTYMKVGFIYLTSEKKCCSTPWGGYYEGSKINVNAPSNCAYVAVVIAYKDGRSMSVSDVLKSGIAITSDRVVSEGEISLMVKKTSDGYISNANITADRINFKTGNFSIKNQNNQTTLALDSNGNLTVSGTINGGTINNNVIVGTSGNKVEIYIDETIFGSLKGSGIRGKNSDGKEVMRLGFAALDNSYTTPYLILSYGKSSGNQHAIMYPDRVEFVVNNTGKQISFGISGSGKIDIHGNAWPTEGVDDISALPTGAVYLRGDSCLGIKR